MEKKLGYQVLRDNRHSLGLAKKTRQQAQGKDAIDNVSVMSPVEFIRAFIEKMDNSSKVNNDPGIYLTDRKIDPSKEQVETITYRGSLKDLEDNLEEIKKDCDINFYWRCSKNPTRINIIFCDEFFVSFCYDDTTEKIRSTIFGDKEEKILFLKKKDTFGLKYTYSNLERIFKAFEEYLSKSQDVNESSLGLAKKVSSDHHDNIDNTVESMSAFDDLDTIAELLEASFKKIGPSNVEIVKPVMNDHYLARELWFKRKDWDSVLTVIVKISQYRYSAKEDPRTHMYVRHSGDNRLENLLVKSIPQEFIETIKDNKYNHNVHNADVMHLFGGANHSDGIPFTVIEKFAECLAKYFSDDNVNESDLGLARKTRANAQDKDPINGIGFIPFEDSAIEEVCHEHGVYTFEDAANVTYIRDWFATLSSRIDEKPEYKKFNEFKYFTGLKNINEGAFAHCVNLEEISIPENVEKIQFAAFSGCRSLKHLHLPENVKTIDMYAFSCESLESINIPDSVVNISVYAFNQAFNLKDVYIKEGHKFYEFFESYNRIDPSEMPVFENTSLLGLAKKTRDKAESKDAIDQVTDLVDMGLPSGNLWTKSNFRHLSGSYDNRYNDQYFRYNDIVGKKNVETKFPKGFSLPTKSDYNELLGMCDYEFTEENGIEGVMLTSKVNGNTLFFPADGYLHKTIQDDLDISGRNEFGFYMSKSLDKDMCGYFLQIQVPINNNNLRRSEFIGITKLAHMSDLYSVRLLSPGKLEESSLGLAKKTRQQAQSKDAVDNLEFGLVDLDLPSGNLWASCNYDASSPEEAGEYFSFQEAISLSNLDGMSVPSLKDYQELVENTTYSVCSFKGTAGAELTSKTNKNVIFFPFSGYVGSEICGEGTSGNFWTCTEGPNYNGWGHYYAIHDNGLYGTVHGDKRFKFSLRLVKKKNVIAEADLGISREETERRMLSESSLGLAKKVREEAEEKTAEDVASEIGTINPEDFMKSLAEYANKSLNISNHLISLENASDDSYDYEELCIDVDDRMSVDFLSPVKAKPYGNGEHGNEEYVGWFGIMFYNFRLGSGRTITLPISSRNFKRAEYLNSSGCMSNYTAIFPCTVETLKLSKEYLKSLF